MEKKPSTRCFWWAIGGFGLPNASGPQLSVTGLPQGGGLFAGPRAGGALFSNVSACGDRQKEVFSRGAPGRTLTTRGLVEALRPEIIGLGPIRKKKKI